MSFGNRLKHARAFIGITQKGLAGKLDISPQNLAQYESGKRNPSNARIKEFAEALELGFNYTKQGQAYFYAFIDPEEPNGDNEAFNKYQLQSALSDDEPRHNSEWNNVEPPEIDSREQMLDDGIEMVSIAMSKLNSLGIITAVGMIEALTQIGGLLKNPEADPKKDEPE